MTTRRNFLKTGGLSLASLMVGQHSFARMAEKADDKLAGAASTTQYVCKRPVPSKRQFTSEAVEKAIATTKAKLKDPKLAWMFENCFPNTLDTTCEHKMVNGKPDTFVLTGDIHAMWLRDSSAQVFPHIQFANDDPKVKTMLAGVINRQTWCINIDPYANGFNEGPTGSEWESDFTDMKKELHERKWEIDSLCYPIRLAYHFWKKTGETSPFDADWDKAMKSIYKTFIEQQRKDNLGPYQFRRKTDRQGDTLLNDGWGSPVNPVGLIVSSFRPSDDATLFGFLIPSNLFAITSLRQLAEMMREIKNDNDFARRCDSLADEVAAAVEKYGIVNHPEYGKVYAFEVDGFYNHVFMDDANVPSLLALPYLGCVDMDDPVYLNTRKLVLSNANPYFFQGKAGEGIGGPHERKWEIDSLCYPIRLAYHFWKKTGETSPFDADWDKAMKSIYKTFIEQQRKDNLGPYQFRRKTDRQGDTLLNDGWGSPVNPVGLIVSSFRPSDDATLFGFLIPSNLFAITSLRQLAEMMREIKNDNDFARRCDSLADEVAAAVEKYGIVNHPEYGKVYAFEVDGFYNHVFMDDANVPSLLALPYLGCVDMDDPVYLNTRKLVLSNANPYFFQGKAGEGIGGPHIGFGYIWPMSIIMRCNTTHDNEEIRKCVKMLRDTDADTGFMHESFYKDDPSKFTRSWFAWVNTLFGEMIYRLVNEGKVDILNNLG